MASHRVERLFLVLCYTFIFVVVVVFREEFVNVEVGVGTRAGDHTGLFRLRFCHSVLPRRQNREILCLFLDDGLPLGVAPVTEGGCSGDYKRMLLILQRIEARLVSGKVCGLLVDRLPQDVGLFSIHDCVCAPVTYQSAVLEAFDDVARELGFPLNVEIKNPIETQR